MNFRLCMGQERRSPYGTLSTTLRADVRPLQRVAGRDHPQASLPQDAIVATQRSGRPISKVNSWLAQTANCSGRYCVGVHPLEYLRSVARHQRADAWSVALEFVDLVAGWGLEGAELSVAARRLLNRRPDAAPLWWAASQLVLAPEPISLAADLRDRLREELPEVLDEGWVVEAAALSNQRVLFVGGDVHRFREAKAIDAPVAVVAPTGVHLDDRYLDRVREGAEGRGDDVHEEPAEGLKIVDVGSISPFASELLRTSAI